MKKYIKIILITIVLITFFNFTHVFALKRAIFPDEQSLQPIPKNVQPNISGNINSDISNYVPIGKKDIEQTSPIIEEMQTQSETQTPFLTFIIVITIILIVILFFIYYYKKNKLEKPN